MDAIHDPSGLVFMNPSIHDAAPAVLLSTTKLSLGPFSGKVKRKIRTPCSMGAVTSCGFSHECVVGRLEGRPERHLYII
jgi:hypothetical protein